MFTFEDSYCSILESDTKLNEAKSYFVENYDFAGREDYRRPFNALSGADLERKTGEVNGLNHLLRQAENGAWFYHVYPEEAWSEDPKKSRVAFFRFMSDDPEADGRPFAIVVPGGGYVNVWNISEGFPIAYELNRQGYHCFVLNYRVPGPAVLPKPLEDYAAALSLIYGHAEEFHLRSRAYFTVGFSAGANLIGLWGTKLHGYEKYGLPKPVCMFMIYAPVSWKLCFDNDVLEWFSQEALGMTLPEAAESSWNIVENTEDYPPCYIAATADDSLVDPENSRMLYRSLQERKIPALLDIGPTGEHGFGDGCGTSMAGWIGRAVDFLKSVL